MNTALTPPSSKTQSQPTPSSAAPSNSQEKDIAKPAVPGRTMHPQGAQAASFGQSQNVFPNMNAAHSHPNAQQNHFSMGSYNMGAIQPSNHPVASQQQSNAGGPQLFNQSKSASYSSSFQGNIGHQTHQNQTNLPPVTQALPPTTQQSVQHSNVVSSGSASNSSTPTVDAEKPQANGTSEATSTPAKAETSPVMGNHVSSSAPQPAQIPSSPQKSEKSKSPVSIAPVPEHQKVQVQESKKPIQETPQAAPLSSPVSATRENGAEIAPVAQDTPKSVPVPPSADSSKESAEDKESPIDGAATTTTPTPVTPALPEETSTDGKDAAVVKATTEAPAAPAEPSQSAETGTESRLEQDPLEAVEEVAVDADKVEEQLSMPAAQSPKKDPLALPAKSPAAPAATTPSPVRAVRKAKTVAAKTAALASEPKTPVAGGSLQRSPSTGGKTKRQRIRTQHYQSPLPEIEIVTKMTSATPRSRGTDDRLIYFYKNEFLAVRNSEGSFYICQAVQNVYKSSSKIKIRWLSQDKDDASGELYTPDFYDLTDFDCILTSLELQRVEKGKFRLKPAEKERTDSILKRCLAVEKGEIVPPSLSEEHPDGLDLSLYKDEEQLKKKGTKRKSRPASKSPSKKTPATKKSPEAAKVKKPNPKVTKKTAPPPKKSAAQPMAKKPAPVDQKKQITVGSKTAKGKRKAPTTKTSPVMDQKKAKVLAKIGRKTAIPVASTSKASVQVTKSKSAKAAPKPTPSTSKAPTKPLKATDRKAKRPLRK
ncbi:unnamed protein product [Callosobruchus maculatus]|uniref:Uncharacterized protein n=1 Tax=Callosobruchus maculatus TaxID=64391 RepID=A0A653CCQ0_CALMS|nr:unnamed protein product [Callosobruchus maculatus]